MFLWKATRGALPVGAQLESRGVMTGVTCVHCGENEIIDHLLLHCSLANEVRDLAPFKDQIFSSNFSSIQAALTQSHQMVCLPPTGLYEGFLFPWIAWSIWIARNQKIFQNRNFTVRETITKATHDALEWISAQTKTQRIDRLTESVTEDPTNLRGFSDAALRSGSGSAGLGWLFKDQENRVVACGSRIEAQVGSVLMAEAIAMREAITQAKSMNLSGFSMNTDSQKLVNLFRSNKFHLELYGIVKDILRIANEIKISFCFTPRSKNEEANALAKAALNVCTT